MTEQAKLFNLNPPARGEDSCMLPIGFGEPGDI